MTLQERVDESRAKDIAGACRVNGPHDERRHVMQAIAIEQQSQRGIVDMETLAKANQDLIDTVTGVLRVQEEGRKKRAQAEQQMEQLTIDLKKAMTQA